MSHSQRDEEEIVLKHFGDRVCRFADIGAFDGKCLSNSYALAERGWSGICCEPAAAAFKALLDTHRDRPGIKLVNALIGSEWKISWFAHSPDAVATADRAHFEVWKKDGQYQEMWMPETPLMALLAAFPGPYEFISIDTEGTSGAIFKAMPLAMLNCEMVCVEFSYADKDELIAHAKSTGYEMHHETAENLIFRKV